MSQSFAPPRIHPARWIFLTVLSVHGVVAAACYFQHWFVPFLFVFLTIGFGNAARRALIQQRIADRATLFTLETATTSKADTDRQERKAA